MLTVRAVHETIDALLDTGMREARYRYVNLDAGWAAPERLPQGELRADPWRFPQGLASIVDDAHERGTVVGLHASPFNQTCGQAVAAASARYEQTEDGVVPIAGDSGCRPSPGP